MLHFVQLLECQFTGNVTNITAVHQPSSACQRFRLFTVCCQRFLHQPIVFLRSEANAYFNSLALCVRAVSFLSSGCRPRFSRLAASPLNALSRAWVTEEKKRDGSQSTGSTAAISSFTYSTMKQFCHVAHS